MSTKNLGRMHKVDLREAWTSECSDFTPWLWPSIVDKAFKGEL